MPKVAGRVEVDKILKGLSQGVVTHKKLMNPLKVQQALEDTYWLISIEEELNNFTCNKVWSLVKRPTGQEHNVIGTKWVFKNKQDDHGTIIRNKARLVAQGYSQVKGLDEKGFQWGLIDATLFTKRSNGELIICQVYVHGITFGSPNLDLCNKFAASMTKEFEMSLVGELKFFLGFQIKQFNEGIFFLSSQVYQGHSQEI
jgi:hypothetical protein